MINCGTRNSLIGAACAVLMACGEKPAETRKVSVAQCPEPFKVVSCSGFSAHGNSECIFENVAERQLSSYPYAWAYTKDGVQVGKMPMMNVSGLLPGKKVQQQVLFNQDSVDRVVVCSVDPDDPLVKSRVAPI